MEATERTFTSWEEWAKERLNKDGGSYQGLYDKLICRINVFTGRKEWLKEQDKKQHYNRYKQPSFEIKLLKSEPLEGIPNEVNRFPTASCSELEGEDVVKIVLDAETQNFIEQDYNDNAEYYNNKNKDEKAYAELDDINKWIIICKFIKKCIEENYNDYKWNKKPYAEPDDRKKNISERDFVSSIRDFANYLVEKEYSLDEYYFKIYGVPFDDDDTLGAELERKNKEKDKDDILGAELAGVPLAELERKNKEKDKDEEEKELKHELDKIKSLREEYKNDIKTQEKYEKKSKKDNDRREQIRSEKKEIEKERKQFWNGKIQRFNNMPDYVIKLFDWLLDKVDEGGKSSKDGSYSMYKLGKDNKNNRWEILAPEDQKYLLELLPKIKEYPDLELSCEDIQDIELKLTEPRLFRLKKIQKMVEDVLNLPQEKIEEYLSILDKLDKMYNLSVKVSEEIERLKEGEGEAEMMRQVDSAIASVMRKEEHAKEQ